MTRCDYNIEHNWIPKSSCPSSYVIVINESSFSSITYTSYGWAAHVNANVQTILHDNNFSDISAVSRGGAIYFNNIKVGVLKTSETCYKLNLTECEFNDCDDSVNCHIISTALNNFTMKKVNLRM